MNHFLRPIAAEALSAVLLLAIVTLMGCGQSSPTPSESSWRRPAKPTAASVTSESFRTQSSVEHPSLFDKLSASSIGIGFVHEWKPTSELFMQIRSYACTAGVTIGDYDSDGFPDLFLASQTDGGKLYRNLGNWKFQDVTAAANVDATGVWATGVSFVDINNDSLLDLTLCGFNCANRVFINQGNGTFEEQSKQLGLDYRGASTMMSFVDYDRDGDLDTYLLTNRLPPKRRQTGRATKLNGRVVVPDHLLEETGVMNLPNGEFHFMPAGQFDYMLRNDGDSFTDVTAAAGMAKRNHHGLSATWWDPNNDGWPDLFVSNDFAWPDHFFVHNGDGSAPAFVDRVRSAMPNVPWFSMGSDVGDFNNDGRIDLIATDMSPTSHYRSKLTMGDMSTFAWFLDQADPPQYMRNAMLLNTGTDRFQEVAQMAGVANSDWTWSVRAEDFDCDGLTDLFMTTGMTRDFENADLTDELDRLQASSRTNAERVTIASRFWRDKPQQKEANIAFRNEGNLRFANVGQDWGLDEKSVAFGCATGDLDGDGDLDIVVNNFRSSPSVYRNLTAEQEEGTNHRIQIRLQGRTSNAFGIGARIELAAGDLKQLRYLALARGYLSSSEPVVHFGLGRHEQVDKLTIYWPSGIVQTLSDLQANRKYVVTEPDDSEPGVSQSERKSPVIDIHPLFRESDIVKGIRHREQPFDDFARQPLLPNRLSQLGPGLAWGDIDGDGTDDLYVGGAHGEPGRPHFRRNGKFLIYAKKLQAFIADADCEDMGSLLFDAEGDGDLDLYVVSGGVECEPGSDTLLDRLYVNDGSGQFDKAAARTLPDLRFSGSCVVGADFDRDGDVDLFVGGRTVPGKYPTTPRSCLLENQSTTGVLKFIDATPNRSEAMRHTGMVTSAIWSDVDNDQWVDLLVTHDWGPVKLYLNEEGKLVDATDHAGLSNRQGWFNGIQGGDVDHDGDVDFVVTNFGQNTKYHASDKNPTEIYYGHFDDSAQMRIVEAMHKESRLMPVRGKSCSQNAMPFLRSKFPTYHDFALQSLEELYSRPSLDGALRLHANELDSGVLLNDGSGRFEWRPLPRIAQVAPAFGVQVADFNLDGHLDIALAQNFFGPQRETGRMHGGVGQLLVGTGTGHFHPVSPCESGFVVPDDAKALTVADLDSDNKPDLVVSSNNGPVRAFVNQSAPSKQLLVIRLRGKAGNPMALGARIEVSQTTSDRQITEIYGGGSYLSQSSSTRTFAVDSGETLDVRVTWPTGLKSILQVTDEVELVIREPSKPTAEAP